MEHLHAYVHADTAEVLRANAAANDRSLAAEVRRGLRMYAEVIRRQSVQPPLQEPGEGAILQGQPTEGRQDALLTQDR